jgi:hypothetical protein
MPAVELGIRRIFVRPSVTTVHGVVPLAALILLGCEEPCELGATRCNQGAAETCEVRDSDGEHEGTQWAPDDCGQGACIELPNVPAFCARDAAPDPRCDPSQPFGGLCEGNAAVSCHHGFVTRTLDCSELSLFCVEPDDGGALCALEEEPDAVCEGIDRGSSCAGTTVVYCESGYATRQRECRYAGLACEGTPEATCR